MLSEDCRITGHRGHPAAGAIRVCHEGPLMTHLTPHGILGQSPGQRKRLVLDLAVRQCLLEFLNAFLRDLRFADPQLFEVGQM